MFLKGVRTIFSQNLQVLLQVLKQSVGLKISATAVGVRLNWRVFCRAFQSKARRYPAA